MEKYLNQPKLDSRMCNSCRHFDTCILLDPNDGYCEKYEDYLVYCEYQTEGER